MYKYYNSIQLKECYTIHNFGRKYSIKISLIVKMNSRFTHIGFTIIVYKL